MGDGEHHLEGLAGDPLLPAVLSPIGLVARDEFPAEVIEAIGSHALWPRSSHIAWPPEGGEECLCQPKNRPPCSWGCCQTRWPKRKQGEGDLPGGRGPGPALA